MTNEGTTTPNTDHTPPAVPIDLITDENGGIERQRSRRGLGQCQQVEKFRPFDPSPAVDDLLLDQGHHRISSAERKIPIFKKDQNKSNDLRIVKRYSSNFKSFFIQESDRMRRYDGGRLGTQPAVPQRNRNETVCGTPGRSPLSKVAFRADQHQHVLSAANAISAGSSPRRPRNGRLAFSRRTVVRSTRETGSARPPADARLSTTALTAPVTTRINRSVLTVRRSQ